MKPVIVIKEKDDGKLSSYFLMEPETGKILWDGAKKKCRHSYIKAQGIGGGHIFLYCNKCGKTKIDNASETGSKWIKVSDRLPSVDSWDIRCMIRFTDGYETTSDYGTVHDSFRKLKDQYITHWKDIEV